jgi:hypothetical protein
MKKAGQPLRPPAKICLLGYTAPTNACSSSIES